MGISNFVENTNNAEVVPMIVFKEFVYFLTYRVSRFRTFPGH